MADQFSPTPVKTITDGDVVAKVSDGTNDAAVSASGELSVQVTQALPAGDNNIGNVDIVTGPTGASALEVQGTAADGAAAVGDPIQMGGVDGASNIQAIAVDTDGQLQIDVVDALPAGDNNIGNVDIVSGPTGASALEVQGTAADGAAAVGDPIQVGGVDGSSNIQSLSVDTNGQLQIDIVGALPAGDNNIGNVDIVSGPTGASALEVQGTAADGAAAVGDPVQIGGKDGGGNVQTLTTDTDGHLQVDILSGGGSDTPTNPSTDTVTSAAVASGGGTANLDTATLSNTTHKLDAVAIGSSVRCKWDVGTFNGSVFTSVVVFFTDAGGSKHIDFASRDFITFAADGVDDVFRIVVTNLSSFFAADVYATFFRSTV